MSPTPFGSLPGYARVLLLGGAALLTVGLALHVSFALGLVHQPAGSEILSSHLYTALLIGGALGALARAILVPTNRAPWFLFAGGAMAWAMGELYWEARVSGLDPEPFPTPADGLWLAFYPLIFSGVLLLAYRGRSTRLPRVLWLDGIAGAAAVSGVGAAIILPAILDSTEGSFASVAVTLAYPLGDLLLLAFVVGALVLSGWSPGRLWLLVGVALSVSGLADGIYLLQIAQETYVEGTILDSLWPAGMLVFAIAAWQPARAWDPSLKGWHILVAPALFGLIALTTLVYGGAVSNSLAALILPAVALVAVLVRLAMTNFSNVQLADDLEDASLRATRDPLTGVLNHRRFHDQLEQAFMRPQPRGLPTSLILVDADHFKHVNDAFGHLVGDQALIELATTLRKHARETDAIGRVGGEEFAWLVPGKSGREAEAIAERARLGIQSADITPGEALTVSLGISDTTRAEDAADLYRQADDALYAAKRGGRNQTEVYGSPGNGTGRDAPKRPEGSDLDALKELARSVDSKDPMTHRHSERVATSAVRIGERLGWSAERLRLLRDASLVHDIGKIGVPDGILLKPGPLTEGEMDIVREHPKRGAEVLRGVLSEEQCSWVLHHHESWDGSGYPSGLSADATPLGAQIISAADAWDAMTSPRQYRTPLTHEEALVEVLQHSGRQWSEDLSEILAAIAAEDDFALPPPRDPRVALKG